MKFSSVAFGLCVQDVLARIKKYNHILKVQVSYNTKSMQLGS